MRVKAVMLTFCIILVLSTTYATASTDCTRTVKNVWNNTSINTVMVCFESPDHGCVYLTTGTSSNLARIDRFYSMALTALTTNMKVIVRYPEDNADCSYQPKRNDINGMWITNEQ